jgi:hypothetical protein
MKLPTKIQWVVQRWEAVCATTVAVVAVAGFCVVVYKANEFNKLQAENNVLHEAQLDAHLEEVMMGLDRYFAANQQLRRYFYGGQHNNVFPRPGPVRRRAFGIAEMIVDFADDIGSYAERHKMSTESSHHWQEIIGGYFQESPITRRVWYRFHRYYRESTACILEAPFEPQEDWSWKTNRPTGPSKKCTRLL